MKSLLLKDLYLLKQYGKTMLLVLLVLSFSSLRKGGESLSFFTSFLMIFIMMITSTSFTYDEQCHWYKMALSLPIQRRDIVKSKYLLGLITAGLGFLWALFILCLGIAVQKETAFLLELILPIITCLGVGLFCLALMFLFAFRFGIEKGRIAMVIIFMIPMLILALASAGFSISIEGIQISEKAILSGSIGFTIFSFIFYFISYFISCRVFQKKDIN